MVFKFSVWKNEACVCDLYKAERKFLGSKEKWKYKNGLGCFCKSLLELLNICLYVWCVFHCAGAIVVGLYW